MTIPTTDDEFSSLDEADLFADLSSEESAQLDRRVTVRTYPAGELIHSQDHPASALFVLKAGRVRIFRPTEDGGTDTTAVLEPGAVFGEMLLVGQRMGDHCAETLEEARICRFEAREVELHLLSDPRIALRIARLLGEEIALLEDRLADSNPRPLPSRLASTLVRLATGQPHTRHAEVVLRLTEEQLAALLAVTPEETSKGIEDLAARGLLRQSRGRVTLVDLDGLEDLARRRS